MNARSVAICYIVAFVIGIGVGSAAFSGNYNNLESRLSEAIRVSDQLASENRWLIDANRELAKRLRNAIRTTDGLKTTIDRITATLEGIGNGLKGASREARELVELVIRIGKGTSPDTN